MEYTKATKQKLLFVIFFSAVAIAFGLLYYFEIIKNFNLTMAVAYVLYFVGLALVFNGSYCRETGREKGKKLNYLFGVLFILGAGALLIYGFSTGTVSMFH